MKTAAIILTLTFVSSFASASFWQKTCANASGYTTSANGHLKNHLTLTEIKRDENNKTAFRPIKINQQRFPVETLEKVILVEESTESCDSNFNIGSHRTVTFEKIKITRKDRSLFSSKIFGVSLDRASVTAELICEREISGPIACPND